jgi:hypothetical protein
MLACPIGKRAQHVSLGSPPSALAAGVRSGSIERHPIAVFRGSCAARPNQVRARGLVRRRRVMMFDRPSAGGREARMGSRKIVLAQWV